LETEEWRPQASRQRDPSSSARGRTLRQNGHSGKIEDGKKRRRQGTTTKSSCLWLRTNLAAAPNGWHAYYEQGAKKKTKGTKVVAQTQKRKLLHVRGSWGTSRTRRKTERELNSRVVSRKSKWRPKLQLLFGQHKLERNLWRLLADKRETDKNKKK